MVCPSPWWCCTWGSSQGPCFCSQHLRCGSWFVAFLYLIVPNLPHLHMPAVIFSPFYFILISSLEEMFVQGQALQLRVPDSSLSQFQNLPAKKETHLFPVLTCGCRPSFCKPKNSPVDVRSPREERQEDLGPKTWDLLDHNVNT